MVRELKSIEESEVQRVSQTARLTTKSISRKVDQKQEDFIKRLREAVAIPSVSGDPSFFQQCEKMTKWAEDLMKRLGATTELVYPTKKDNGDAVPPILFADLGQDPNKATLLIYGHLDVQPAKKEDGWETEPFELVEKDGKMFGRGSSDDKGPVLAWINVIETMQEMKMPIEVNLKFCFECKEESGSVGLDEELAKRKETWLKKVDFTCISDNTWLSTTKPCLTFGLRGICYFTIEVVCADRDLDSVIYGGQIHDGLGDLLWIMAQLTDPAGTVNIPGLAAMVAPVTPEEKELYSRITFDPSDYKKTAGAFGLTTEDKLELLMRKWRYPSLSLHGIEGAYAGPGVKNIIPSRVVAKFSIRLAPNMEPKAIEAAVCHHIEQTLWPQRQSTNSCRVAMTQGGRAWLGDYKDANYQAGIRATRRIYGIEPDMTREGGSIPVTLTLQEQVGHAAPVWRQRRHGSQPE